MLFEGFKKALSFMATHKIKFDIHTFIGAGLTVWYFFVFTGKVANFHGFSDTIPLLSGYNLRGMGAILLMSLAALFLIIFGRGPLVLVGYMLVFMSYVILSSFESPKPLPPQQKVVSMAAPHHHQRHYLNMAQGIVSPIPIYFKKN
jgi:hypothetical protein